MAGVAALPDRPTPEAAAVAPAQTVVGVMMEGADVAALNCEEGSGNGNVGAARAGVADCNKCLLITLSKIGNKELNETAPASACRLRSSCKLVTTMLTSMEVVIVKVVTE